MLLGCIPILDLPYGAHLLLVVNTALENEIFFSLTLI